MLLKISPLKSISLASALFFLSVKGVDEVVFSDTAYAINYPEVAILLKNYGLILGGLSLSIYIALSIILGKVRRINVPLAASGVLIPTVFYYFRSAAAGNEWLVNIIAAFVLLFFTYGLLLAIKVENKKAHSWSWYDALFYFYTAYLLATFLLYLTGYGYLEVGNRRFFGLASHPNALGQVASLAFGFFVISSLDVKCRGRKKVFNVTLSLIALYCALLSGSRAAILMCGLCALAFPGRIFLVIFLASLLSSLTVGFEFVLGNAGFISIERMLSAPLDNRDEVWSLLWLDFLAQPFIGVGDTTGVSGSTYLTALSGTGFVFGIMYITTLAWLAYVSFRKLLIFRLTRRYQLMLICSVAILQFTAGALFEARLFDKFSHMPLIFLLSIAVLYQKKPLEKGISEPLPYFKHSLNKA